MSTANTGDTVRVHYTGTLESGQEFDSSRGRDPIAFELGKHQVIPGFEEAVVGMEPGEKKTITIAAEEAYGPRREDLVFTLPQDQFPGDIKLEKGLRVTGTTQEGQSIGMTVVDFTDETVTLDANHPLAGESLIFEIELVEIT
ncbi:MAG: peptidylprolyl isomerase [Rhodothalassiaceae bacterium]